MTQQQIDAIVTGLLEQGVIDESWLLAPCKIAHSDEIQPHTAVWLHWLAVATFITIAALTVGLVVFVAMNSGEL